MKLKSTLFPPRARSFPGLRSLNITLRTLHLIGVVGLGGAYLYNVPRALWEPYLLLTLFSGTAMIAISIYGSAIWLLQLRGQLIMLKLVLLAWIWMQPDLSFVLIIVVVIISSVIAHAPGNLRYYSLWHGRRLDRL